MPPSALTAVSEEADESWSSSSSDSESDFDDDALSLAESLNSERGAVAESVLKLPPSPESPPNLSTQPEPPLPTNPTQDRLPRSASAGSHLAGAGRERMLLCGAGAVWTLGREPGEAPRFLPAGISASGGPLAAPVLAAACGPAGLIVLAHEAVTPGARGRPTLSIWSAPALGLQTPSCVATVRCDRELRGGASAVGFAGGPARPLSGWRRSHDPAPPSSPSTGAPTRHDSRGGGGRRRGSSGGDAP